MGRPRKSPPVAENLSAAAAMLLRMKRSEFNAFEPRNTAEAAAYNLAIQSLRGDAHAFRELYNAADRSELIQDAVENIDALSRSLMELGESL